MRKGERTNAPAPLAIRPLQWAALPELQDAPPLDEADMACLAELRAVLARRGKLERFAVHLAHRHFALGPGEILVERPDPDGRTQHVTVALRGEEPDGRPTTWLFEDGPTLSLSEAVYCVCLSDSVHQAGCVRHGKSPSPGKHAETEDRRERPVAGQTGGGAIRPFERTGTASASPGRLSTGNSASIR